MDTLPLGLFGWIIIGGLAGWVASKFMGTDRRQGILMNVLVGVVGGLLGGAILVVAFNIDISSGNVLFSFFTCLGGSVLLLFLWTRVLRR